MPRRTQLCEPPLSKFNNIMANAGIKPVFTLIFQESKRAKIHDGSWIMEKYMMRVTCPISLGSPPVSADGSYGRSLKEAKHFAAQAFMDKYLNGGYNVQSRTRQTSPKSTVDIVNISSEELDMLEVICLKKGLGKPEVKDVGVAGLSRAPTFTAESKVSGLRIEGKGSSKCEARLQAIVKMMQMIMGTVPMHEILKFPKLTPSEIQLTLKSTNDEITVSSSTDRKEFQPTMKNDINGNQRTDPRSPKKSTTRINPDRTKTLLEFMNAHKKAGRIGDRNNNSASNVNRMDSTEDSQQKTLLSEADKVSDSVNSRAERTSSNKFRKNLTQLQVVSQIDRSLGNLEEQLSDNMLNALAYCNLPNQQSVLILSHDYEVFIEESSPPMIFRGDVECTDQSIRTACLIKLLIDLKKHIEINQKKGVK